MSEFLTIEQKVECLRDEVGQLKEQLQVFLKVGEVSLQDALSRARTILEFVVGKIMLDEGLQAENELSTNIEILGVRDGKLAARRRKDPEAPVPPPVLPAPLYSSLHNIRVYGNSVVHPWDPQTMELKGVKITPLDLQIVLGQILRLIEWYFQEYPRGQHIDPLYRGLPDPVLGVSSDVPPDPAGLVGRSAEATQLVEWLRDGRTKLITVLAPAGMGKTTLASRAAFEVASGWRAGQGLLLWMDLKGAPSFGEVSARILASLQPGSQPTDRDIAQHPRAARIAQIVRRMVERPVLLVLDNVESWLDPSTRVPRDPHVAQLLAHVGTRAHRGRALLTSRAEVDVPELPPAACALLRLGRLPLEDARVLLLGQGIASGDDDARAAWERLDGNPRLLIMLAEVLRKRGCRDLGRGMERFPNLAAGAADGLLAQVWVELPTEAQEVLKILAVLRPPSAPADLDGTWARIAPAPHPGADAVLWDQLVPRALVTPGPEGETFAVEHLLIRDYALRRWSDVAEAHRAAMAHYLGALAEAPADGADLRPSASAHHHALAAGDLETAAGLVIDGTLPRELGRQGRTLELWELCRPLVDASDHLPVGCRCRLLRLGASCLDNLGDYAAASELMGRCLADLGDLRGTSEEAHVLRTACSIWRKQHQYENAERAGLRALDLAHEQGRLEDETRAMIELVALERNLGRHREAARRAAATLELADRSGDPTLRAWAYSNLARGFVGGGNLNRAERHFQTALELSRQSHDVRMEAQILQSIADIARRRNRNAEAIELANEAIAIFQRINDRTGEAIARSCRGLTIHQMGEKHARDGVEELRQSLRISFDLHHPREVAARLCELARVFEGLEPIPTAAACFQTALDLHRAMGHAWRKGERYLDGLRLAAEQEGLDWAAVEREARERHVALLECASLIDAAQWRAFLAEVACVQEDPPLSSTGHAGVAQS